MCIHNTANSWAQVLRDEWGSVSVDEAHDTLSKPDIQVTNEGDKEKQLKKLAKLDGVCANMCRRHTAQAW